MNRRRSTNECELSHAPGEYVTHVLVPRGSSVYDREADWRGLGDLGIKVIEVDSSDPRGDGQVRFEAMALVEAIDAVVREGPGG